MSKLKSLLQAARQIEGSIKNRNLASFKIDEFMGKLFKNVKTLIVPKLPIFINVHNNFQATKWPGKFQCLPPRWLGL